MYYWQNIGKDSLAEVDYVIARRGKVLPIEVKANTQGSMQSLWMFMRKHNLHNAIRVSLENFGHILYTDRYGENAERNIDILPLYALSNLMETEC